MVVFDGVRYSLSPSLPPTRRNELAAVLDLNGAAPHSPYTHLIALPASNAHNATNPDQSIKLVTDRWVDRSVVMGKRQPEQYYSPDPAMIFSGVVACATDLSAADLEVLSAGITALGGQWRIGLTRDVTHLFALRAGSDKYNTALHFAPQTHMRIVTPHWFDDSVRLGRRIPETPYSWPDPPVLHPGLPLDPDKGLLATEAKTRRKLAGDAEAEAENTTNAPNQGQQVRVWAGRRVLLSTSLELGEGSRRAIEVGIQRAGGVIVRIADDANEDIEERVVDESDVLVTRWRSGKSYFKAARASLLIGTLSWLFSVESSGTLHSPLDSLLWYPTPKGGIQDLIGCEISITNYTGAARDYLKRLIVLIGAKFTPSMSQSNKVLVAGFQPSPKTTRALSWSIPVVNHTWLEDCVVEWRALTVGLERYIVYPPGIDFGKLLMTRHDGPPSSQSVPAPRLNGGAVPGGRGIGVVDIEQEETRDAEYRALAGANDSAQGLLTGYEAFGNDTTTDGVSVTGFVGNAPKETLEALSRAGSVKKTLSSSRRSKRGSISTPISGSAMGAFVDQVIELPSDDGEDGVGDKRRTPTNGKLGARASPRGSHATPRSTSKPSSGGLRRTERKVEVVVRDPGSSRSENGRGKGKEREVIVDMEEKMPKDTERGSTRPACEEEKSEDAKYEPHPTSRGSKVRTAQTKGTEEAVAQQKKRRKAMDSDSRSDDDEGSEVFLPPRRTIGTGSTTPVKSGMKPRPRSKSQSRPRSVLGEESEVRVLAAESEVVTENARKEQRKPTHAGEHVTKEKGKCQAKEGEKGGRDRKKGLPLSRSSTHSPSPIPRDAKILCTPKRRLSVLVPSVPKDYFSSPGLRSTIEGKRDSGSGKEGIDSGATLGSKHKRPESMRAVAAEASTSTSKRAKPSPAATPLTSSVKIKTQTRGKLRTVSSKAAKNRANDGDDDMDEDHGTSIIVDPPVASTISRGPRRSAADKATTQLREVIIPDVVSFEKEKKQMKRKRSVGGTAAVPVRLDEDEERVEKGGKRRKFAVEEEEEEEAEVEDVVLAPSAKAKQNLASSRGKMSRTVDGGSDKDKAKNKLNRLQEKKGTGGQGKESVAIRLMTTGVTLSDDVIKRLTKLGVQMTTKPSDCTHLVAKGIVRTEKFLCAMSVSPYILTEEWANGSAKSGKLLGENDYLLADTAAEKKWAFKLADALERAKGLEGGPNLFRQVTFYVTPKVSVDTKLLKNVVTSGGGQVQTSTMPTVRILKGKSNRYVVSCEEDKAIWRPLVQEGIKVYSPELVLRGVLRQEMEWEREDCLVMV